MGHLPDPKDECKRTHARSDEAPAIVAPAAAPKALGPFRARARTAACALAGGRPLCTATSLTWIRCFFARSLVRVHQMRQLLSEGSFRLFSLSAYAAPSCFAALQLLSPRFLRCPEAAWPGSAGADGSHLPCSCCRCSCRSPDGVPQAPAKEL